jgi:glycosyltransferase involved in cell wall biosynthesis
MPFSIHGIFPNYYDDTWVSHTFMSLIENMQCDELEIKALVGSKAKFINKPHIQAILPLKLQRLLLMFGWSNKPQNLLSLVRMSRFHAGDIAYLWLASPPCFSEKLHAKGVMVVREMINCTLAMRRDELRKAYHLFDGSIYEGITDQDIENERQQLTSADFIFCTSRFVKQSVMDYGIPERCCIDGSYGWSPQRLNAQTRLLPNCDGITLAFVGTADVRKGAPVLLEAWSKSDVKGRLILAGRIADEVKHKCATWLDRDDVVCLGHVDDVGTVYRSADIFCLPTWEEGAPLVTIEAMSQGLPVIVTPMGTSGLLSEGEDIGLLVVPPGNVEALVQAIQLLAKDKELRKNMGLLAQQRSMLFTWEQVSKRRLDLLLEKRTEWLSCQ